MKKLFILVLLPLAVTAQKNYSKELDKYMQAQMNVKGFSGAVLVMQHDKVLLKKGYGLADREWNVANTADTKFRIGSITKQFTAACILQLVELGKLSLSDRLSKFFPDFPKGDSVTIHMLLSHTSGIANYTDLPGFENVEKLSWSKDSMISFFKNKPYTHSPGTKFKYSNSGYFLLGCVIEKVSGQSYKTYIQNHIFNVLDMNNSGVDRLDSIIPMHARGYSKEKNTFRNAALISMEWPFSAGVLFSTTEDLYKWDRALNDTTILSASSKQKMFTPGKGNYGYGMITDSLENHYRNWHNGGIPGFLSNISRYPNDDVCVIVLGNTDISLSNTLSISDVVADGLAGIVFGLPVETPYIHTEVKVDESILDRYVGKYKAFLTLEVIKKDGKLYRHRDKSPDIELKPESNTKFFYNDDSDRQLEFEVDKDGKVTKIWFINNENRGEMKKVE
jgi:CubicO group peptidase (beta-lactamase class C family)